MSTLKELMGDVEIFQKLILRKAPPTEVTPLSATEKGVAVTDLSSSVKDFKEGMASGDSAEALTELAYKSLALLIDMGYSPKASFDEVHHAWMRKERLGRTHLAIKGPGHQPADFAAHLKCTLQDMHRGIWRPKIVVCGHGRHGKDTTCEIMRDKFGLRFTSSSWWIAENLMMDYFAKKGTPYLTAQACFDDRHNNGNRKIWFDEVVDYGRRMGDPAAVARAVLKESAMYCGLRAGPEWQCLKTSIPGIVMIWVDRSEHEGPESTDSMTVKKEEAHFVIDNNGTLEELETQIRLTLRVIFGSTHVHFLETEHAQRTAAAPREKETS